MCSPTVWKKCTWEKSIFKYHVFCSMCWELTYFSLKTVWLCKPIWRTHTSLWPVVSTPPSGDAAEEASPTPPIAVLLGDWLLVNVGDSKAVPCRAKFSYSVLITNLIDLMNAKGSLMSFVTSFLELRPGISDNPCIFLCYLSTVGAVCATLRIAEFAGPTNCATNIASPTRH